MQTLLSQLNSVPGVVGSMVCDTEGQLVSYAFPQVFDASMLKEAAVVLADSSIGLETVTGSLSLYDLRYGESRIVVKPVPGAFLLLLCAKAVNLQLLLISCSVAMRKIEKAMVEQKAQAQLQAQAASVKSLKSAKEAKEAKDEKKQEEKKPEKKRRVDPSWWPSM